MDDHELMNALNSLAEQARSIPYLNAGGCAVFAAEVGARLPARCNPRVLVSDSSLLLDQTPTALGDVWRNYRDNIHCNRDWDEFHIGMSHVTVSLSLYGKPYHYDSNGVFPYASCDPNCEYPYYWDTLPVSHMQQLADDAAGWNTLFDRSTGIPKIQSLCDKFLGKIA